MTTVERLIAAAKALQFTHSRPRSYGQYIDELLIQAAEELKQADLRYLDLVRKTLPLDDKEQ